jgi:colanic acid biosynthesis glycosyl transferase WcaI
MVGGGKRFDQLRGTVKQRGDRSFRFPPHYQDRSRLTFSLGVCDAHWLSLDPKLEGLIVLFTGSRRRADPLSSLARPIGELAGLVREHGCDAVVEPGNAAALTTVLRRLSIDPEMAAAMGHQA